eukprot:COSAG06_NODE_83_length_25105_cov_69.740913_9_plen_129_part_00
MAGMLEHMKDKISNDESFIPAGIFAAMEKVTEGEAALQAKDAEIEARDAALQQVEQEKAQMEDNMRERESSLKKQMAEEKQQMQQQLLGDCAAVTQALIDSIGHYRNRFTTLLHHNPCEFTKTTLRTA